MGIFDFFGKSNIVYFPECITYFKFKNSFELYKKIFSKLGISFIVLDKHNCSGIEALEAGYENDARQIARKNFDIFLKEGIKSIMTESPQSYKMFLQNYPQIIPEWNLEVVNLWQLFLKKIKNNPNLIKYIVDEEIAYNDNCYLGRYCNIYDEPREILKLLGYEIKELDNSRENSFCCGSCGLLPIINPEIANKVAKERILQARRINVKKIVVIGLEDYSLLKANSDSIEILELSEVLGKALGITKEINENENILLETKANIGLEEEIRDDLINNEK